MTYPVMVFVMAILAVIGMLLFIVPVFEDMFADLGGALPLPTQFLVLLSGLMTWVAPGARRRDARGCRCGGGRTAHDDAVRSRLDPLGAPAADLRAAVREGRGRPLHPQLRHHARRRRAHPPGAGDRRADERQLGRRAGRAPRSGRACGPVSRWPAPLARHPVFPPMVVQMIATGEDAGALETMLAKISEFYDDEVEATTEQLTSLIEPLMIAILGVRHRRHDRRPLPADLLDLRARRLTPGAVPRRASRPVPARGCRRPGESTGNRLAERLTRPVALGR